MKERPAADADEKRNERLAAWCLFFGVLFAAAVLAVATLRTVSTVEDAAYAQSTGGEGPGLYGIYKVWSGRPLYEPLLKNPTTLVFNYLFYYSYGCAAKLFVSDAADLPVFTHLLTLAATLLFAAMLFLHLWRDLRGAAPGDKALRAVVLLMPFAVFLGPFVGWWSLTARPDLAAAGLELCALLLFLRLPAAERFPLGLLLISTLLFGLAWSFKQTTVFVWGGTIPVLLRSRRYKELLLSVVVFAAMVAAPFLLFGHVYVEHAVTAPGIGHWFFRQFAAVGRDAAAVGGYVFLPTLLTVVFLRFPQKNRSPVLDALLVVLAVAFVGNALTTPREGGWRNYYFAAYFTAALFNAKCLTTVLKQKTAVGRRALLAVTLGGCLYGALLSTAYLAFPGKVGRLDLLTAERQEELQRMCAVLKAADKPVFVQASFYALPWYCGQYPSEVISWTFYRRGETRDDVFSVTDGFKTGHYAEVFVYKGSRWARLAERCGYVRSGPAGRLLRYVRRKPADKRLPKTRMEERDG